MWLAPSRLCPGPRVRLEIEADVSEGELEHVDERRERDHANQCRWWRGQELRPEGRHEQARASSQEDRGGVEGCFEEESKAYAAAALSLASVTSNRTAHSTQHVPAHSHQGPGQQPGPGPGSHAALL